MMAGMVGNSGRSMSGIVTSGRSSREGFHQSAFGIFIQFGHECLSILGAASVCASKAHTTNQRNIFVLIFQVYPTAINDYDV